MSPLDQHSQFMVKPRYTSSLTHIISLGSFIWDIGKQNSLDATAQNEASHGNWGYSVCLHEFHQKMK